MYIGLTTEGPLMIFLPQLEAAEEESGDCQKF